MNFVNAFACEYEQKPGIAGMIEQIDLCAGVCYGRFVAHLTLDEQTTFVEKLIKRGHYRPLEFGTVYLKFKHTDSVAMSLFKDPWCVVNKVYSNGPIYYVTTNYRYIIEEELEYLIDKYWCEPTQFHAKRRTIMFQLNRSIADEFRTHVSLSSLMQSTRYCSAQDLKVCYPYWFKDADVLTRSLFVSGCTKLQATYNALLRKDLPLQAAREILPLGLATILCLCGFEDIPNTGWRRFIAMRKAPSAHPDAQYLAEQVNHILYETKK